jgi:hypothetical protein
VDLLASDDRSGAVTHVLYRVVNIDEVFRGVTIRAQRQIGKAAHLAVGQQWDAEFKMRHFEPGAAQRYGYKARSAKYLARKERASKATWRVKGTRDQDLVYSGQTMQTVKNTQRPRPFPSRVTIDMPTPSYVSMRPDPRFRDAPNLGEELTTVSPDEVQSLTQTLIVTTEALLEQYWESR